ncbi:MAG: hypothetical protein II244_06490, partial [Clostridia bacterium]|nr:hypothetical protein [Clostridia bacterium]
VTTPLRISRLTSRWDSLQTTSATTRLSTFGLLCLPENVQYTVVTKGNVTFDKNVCTIQYDGAVCDKVEFKKKNS